jgi:hypothetical protein
MEIVYTHMTKRGGFSRGAGGDHVVNLHLVMGDDGVFAEPCNPLSAMGKAERVQCGVPSLAKRREALRQGGEIHMVWRLRLDLA